MIVSERGFSTILVLILGLVLLGVLGGGGYYYYQQQKIQSVTNFESCAKHYPVMTSYPAQCNTPDGRHFVQELSEEEKKRLIPPSIDAEPFSE